MADIVFRIKSPLNGQRPLSATFIQYRSERFFLETQFEPGMPALMRFLRQNRSCSGHAF
jgi:hypothetical protein